MTVRVVIITVKYSTIVEFDSLQVLGVSSQPGMTRIITRVCITYYLLYSSDLHSGILLSDMWPG